MRVVISATGLYTPSESISNKELVKSYNAYVDLYNRRIKKQSHTKS